MKEPKPEPQPDSADARVTKFLEAMPDILKRLDEFKSQVGRGEIAGDDMKRRFQEILRDLDTEINKAKTKPPPSENSG